MSKKPSRLNMNSASSDNLTAPEHSPAAHSPSPNGAGFTPEQYSTFEKKNPNCVSTDTSISSQMPIFELVVKSIHSLFSVPRRRVVLQKNKCFSSQTVFGKKL